LSRTPNPIEQSLTDELARAETERDAITARWNQVSNLRLVSAVICAGLVFWWIRTGSDWYGVVAAIAALCFLGALLWHRRIGAQRRDLIARVVLRQRALARLRRDWRSLPDPALSTTVPDHPYANDLDLTGHGSLQQLVDTAQTPAGHATVLDWLLSGAPGNEIRRRQVIAAEVAGAGIWRENLAVAGFNGGQPSGDLERLLVWLERTSQRGVGVRHLLAFALAGITLLVAVPASFGIIALVWLLPFLFANALLRFASPFAGELGAISTHVRSLRQYRAVLPVAEAIPGESPEVRSVRSTFRPGGESASRQLAELDRALACVIPAGAILWLPLQLLLNWDLVLHGVVSHLARSFGTRVRGWVQAAGEVEALSALGDLSALNPDWTWPQIDEGGDTVDGRALGHPLLPPDRRVPNDVAVGPKGTILVVTGSNMAGKSTLLRAIGLNAVLARAGGPTCAASLRLPNVPIWSSVRVQDSLEQGISLYMAELLRLKQIVQAAERAPILYLLDEILHGTNTTERRIAARTVIRTLLSTGSIGAVSTHDLELVDESLRQAAVLVHLVDEVVDNPDGPQMHFDYKLRPGLAPSSNALRLLEMVGLGDGAAD
jgi:hypothetical protein